MKIAILGSQPASLGLAPFGDSSWTIWGCSPGCFAYVAKQRCDAFFELHRWQPSIPGRFGEPGTKPWFSPEYHAYLKEFRGTVWMTERQPDIEHSEPFPYKQIIEKHGPYHVTSSIAWMMAFALEQPGVTEIGLWGVDMAAESEYAYQRPGMQHFVGLAVAMGIKIHLPPESDLMRPTIMYGIGEHSERYIKLTARLQEMDARIADAKAQRDHCNTMIAHLEGAREATQYMITVWSDDVVAKPADAVSFSSRYGLGVVPEAPAPAPEKKARKPRAQRVPMKGNGIDHAEQRAN